MMNGGPFFYLQIVSLSIRADNLAIIPVEFSGMNSRLTSLPMLL